MRCPYCDLVHGMMGAHLVDRVCRECSDHILGPNVICGPCADQMGACQLCQELIKPGDDYHDAIEKKVSEIAAWVSMDGPRDTFVKKFRDYDALIAGKSRDEVIAICKSRDNRVVF